MSYEQYNQFPGAAGQDGPPGQVASPQDGGMGGGMVGPQGDQSQQNQFPPQGHNGGDPGSAGGDQKTTLWYVAIEVQQDLALTCYLGWVNLSHGLTRISSATCGSRWVSKSVSR